MKRGRVFRQVRAEDRADMTLGKAARGQSGGRRCTFLVQSAYESVRPVRPSMKAALSPRRAVASNSHGVRATSGISSAVRGLQRSWDGKHTPHGTSGAAETGEPDRKEADCWDMGRALIIGKDGPLMAALQASDLLRGHELVRCGGDVEALHQFRERAFDVAVTNPATSIAEDLALATELCRARPGLRIIALSPAASHEDLIAALRAHVFACFTPPFDALEIAGMIRSALDASAWHTASRWCPAWRTGARSACRATCSPPIDSCVSCQSTSP